MRRLRIVAAFIWGIAATCSASRAFAQDATYGRIDGDVEAVVGAGAVVASRGPRIEGEVRFRYLESAGVFVTYEDGAIVGSAAQPARAIGMGGEIRPLFLGRWLRGLEWGRPRADMLVDSLGLELGVVFYEPAGASFAQNPAFQLGLGIELPLFARATGMFVGVHGGLRWSDVAVGMGRVSDASDRAAFLAVTLAWHQTLATHLVDAGDTLPR